MKQLLHHWELVNCDSSGLFFHKRKNGGAQWLYTLYEYHRAIGLGALSDISLKQKQLTM
ncbi:hypothetical protein GGR08_000484 [Bartonella fuyuanensis]|uniref:Uncharacterized protein n=1 Tax=Bartonella fuyuanensis TaxID=1460968 RepID=A0A840DSZ1_9HYPH|nr:hypothetical protein [Bartonella fuyuanensis]MBB4076191.1 hypothetical protein [Bartonella fuyuanensis]